MDINISQNPIPPAEAKHTSRETGRSVSRTVRCHPDLILCIDKLNSLVAAEDDWLHGGLLEKAAAELRVITHEYGISPVQAIILCRFLERHDEITLVLEEEIAADLHVSKIGLLRFQDDIERLKEKRLIMANSGEDNPRYAVCPGVIEALRRGKRYKKAASQNLTPEEFFEAVKEIYDQRENKWLGYRDFIGELRALMEGSKKIRFSEQMRKLKLCEEDMIIVTYLCFMNAGTECDDFFLSPLTLCVEKMSFFKRTERSLDEGKHKLIREKIIERVPEDEPDFYGTDEPRYRLTETAKKLMLGDLPVLRMRKKRKNFPEGSSYAGETKAKELFYNESEKRQIAVIEAALTADHYQAIQERLKEKGMPGGIICLFSGGPGTGKTETALQLAHRTGRDIFRTDLSTIRDQYVGGSEKNIKALFDNYRDFLKKSKTAPVLLFNEADGIIGRRIRITNNTVNKTVAQMDNTIQNIILDELEKFEGIFIATTNLTDNMDSAFDRRFLYKIEFKKPGPAVREAIWRSLMPELSAETITVLAAKYDLSGGQIQNIARKSAIDYAVSGRTAGISGLETLCREEQSGKTAEKRIGFGQF